MRRSNLIVILIVALAAAGAIGLFLSRPDSAATLGATPTPDPAAEANSNSSMAASENPILALIQDGDTADTSASQSAPRTDGTYFGNMLTIVLHLLVAVLLSAVLAFRPRKNFPLFRRNLYVAQTQILLSAVAAALMMIVGDNAARAFAIFAAVSIVRFRTNIRDPKEVTVLLISLALGLAAGVGRWDLGIALCGFALVLLYLLEYNEQEQAFRSMEMTIKTRDVERTQELIRKIFTRHKLDAEVRKIDPSGADKPIGCIQYYLNLRMNLSTDDLSETIMQRDTAVEGIEWSKTKSATDVYQ